MTRHVSDQTPADAGVTTGYLVVHDRNGVHAVSGPVTLVRDGDGDWFIHHPDVTVDPGQTDTEADG